MRSDRISAARNLPVLSNETKIFGHSFRVYTLTVVW
jgi:hypothetical protein